MAPRKKDKQAEQLRQDGYQILGLEVKNIMRVKIARIQPGKDGLVIVSGRNGQGKTSLLRAIDFALTGTTTVPSQPIRKGEGFGYVKVDLGDFIVTRHFSRVDPTKSEKGNTYFSKLTIEGKDRSQYRTPQALLDAFMGAFTFDPLAFMRLPDDKKVEALRKVVSFKVDIDQLEADKKATYDERRIVGRELEAAKVRLTATEAPIEGLPEEPIDTAKLSAELGQAYSHNEVVHAKQREIKAAQAEADNLRDKATRLREAARGLLSEATELDGRKSDLAVDDDATEDSKAAAAQKTVDHMKAGDLIDVDGLTNKLQEAQGINAAIVRRGVRRTAEADVKKAQKAFNTLDAKFDELSRQREEAFREAKMPIEGLTIGDGEVLWNGLPFSQASTAQQIRASAAMAIATSPKLRVMRIMDGSLLDDESLDVLREMAEKSQYQIWIERVAGDEPVGIVMEDGEASGDGVVQQAEGAAA